jgi:hypothetical protein
LIIGIDVGKDKHYAFMGTATGKTLLKRLVFENNIKGCEKLLLNIRAIRDQNRLLKIVFGIEPTGNYHKALGMFLINCGYQVVLVGGVAVSRNRELLDGRWDKHDTKCAANIADLISQGKCLFYESPSSDIMDLRNLLSLRRRLKKEEHSLKMRIRNNLIAKYFPELDKYYGQCESENLAIVRWCLDPGLIVSMEFDDFFTLVTTRRYALYQAALVASTRNDIFIEYYTNMLRGRELEKGIKTKMRVKLAVKMLVIAWTLMKNKTPFNPDHICLCKSKHWQTGKE